MVRSTLKSITLFAGRVAVAPVLAAFALCSVVVGRNRAIQGPSQFLSLAPGIVGVILRRAFYSVSLANCHSSVTIGFGTLFSKADISIGRHVYIGAMCHLGWVDLADDVLLASGVHIPSGPNTHGTDRIDVAIREQPGRLRRIHIGKGTWIGSNAVILADVGRDCVIAAGAVVTRPIPDYSIAAGVPARVLRDRRESTAESTDSNLPFPRA